MHAASLAQRFGIVIHQSNGSVRHVSCVHEGSAGDINNTANLDLHPLHVHISRVYDRSAVDVESIAVSAGLDRTQCGLPNAARAFGETHWRRTLNVSTDAACGYLLRIRRVQTYDHM